MDFELENLISRCFHAMFLVPAEGGGVRTNPSKFEPPRFGPAKNKLEMGHAVPLSFLHAVTDRQVQKNLRWTGKYCLDEYAMHVASYARGRTLTSSIHHHRHVCDRTLQLASDMYAIARRRDTTSTVSTSGVAGTLAAQGGRQICRPFVLRV